MLVSGPAGPKDETGIWLLTVLNGDFRKIRDNAYAAWPSPDGSQIAFLSGSTARLTGNEVWVMRANGDNARRLLPPETEFLLARVDWSPDGQRLAYLKRHPESEKAIIESYDFTSGQTSLVMSRPGIKNFCWTPDGRIIFDRPESPPKDVSFNFWQLEIDPRTAQVSGQPQRITDWAGFFFSSLSVTADGKSLTFVKRHDQSDVYIAELEGDGSRMKPPTRLTLDDRMDWPGGWLRDRSALLFYSNRNGSFDIFEQKVDDPVAAVLVSRAEEMRAPQLSPDGSSLLYLAWAPDGQNQAAYKGTLMRIPVSGGSPEVVLEVNGYPGSAHLPRLPFRVSQRGHPDFRCPTAPGSLCVLSEQDRDTGEIIFSAFDPLEGRKREINRCDVDLATPTFWDLSPDGSRIAFGKRKHDSSQIQIIELANAEAKDLAVEGLTLLESVAWSADGESLYVGTWSSKGGSLVHLALNGKTHLLYKAGMWIERPLPSPDGRYLAFGEVGSTSNAWMISDLR